MPAPYQTFNYDPSKGYGTRVAQTALSRWLGTQKQARSMYGQAEKPLQQNVQMFQPGGGYGQGQAQLLQDQARQAQAEALSDQVATGMSSGSLATGTGLRVKKDLAQGLKGVEDTRTQFLAQALQSLSGLRGQRAQTLSATQDPISVPYLSYLGGQDAMANQQAMEVTRNNANMQMAYMRNKNQNKTANSSGYRNVNYY